jgi:CheY-like chemotaxis protein
MAERPKILLLDDEQDLLDLYKEVLSQLPNEPEIHLANSGARAIALLESEPFTLLISDLKMPKMDGLQVLSIVRRKFPDLRVVVMTSVSDEQYRSRAYAMGVDLFWEKPHAAEEIKLFQDCIASLLGQEPQFGFRGVQSKSLVDLIQLECLSQNSSVLKISNGSREGRIWLLNGDVIDAVAGDLNGRIAFKEIFSWKGGSFEILPPEPNRPRTIQEHYQGLLLDTAQAMDEAKSAPPEPPVGGVAAVPLLAKLGRTPGVEFILEMGADGKTDSWSLENPDPLAKWNRESWQALAQWGEKLNIGDIKSVVGLGLQRHVATVTNGNKQLCIGFQRSLSSTDVRTLTKDLRDKWAS